MDVWDRFLGKFLTYIQNYELKKNDGGDLKLEPSYNVDYEIENFEIIAETMAAGGWYIEVIPSKNISSLPKELKKAAVDFLPRFLEEYPQYENAQCLKVIE